MSFGTEFPEDGATTVVDNLARRVSSDARADTVFGDPIAHGDVTVIPVAKVRWAVGGGSGAGGDDGALGDDFGEGTGGAAAVAAKPLGYLEITDGRATYHPIKDRAGMWPLIAAAGFAIWVTLRGLRALRR
jgi:uncharacterized spore protein YtfJ